MKRVLVAGGAGFLGSNLCRKLLKEESEIEVICIDNFYTGNCENIKDLFEYQNFIFVKHDVVNSIRVNKHVDEIYNMACPASPVHYQKNPVYTTMTSVMGAVNLLELAKKYNSKILQASTSEVYGEPIVHPQVENYRGNVNCIGIRSCYDEGKRCAESLFFDYHRMYGVEIKVVRIFNTYGPGMDSSDGRVISNFIVQCLTGKNITVYGNGNQTRSFCYVDDLLEGIIKMMASDKNFLGPINLGNPDEYSVKDIAEIIKNLTCTKVDIEYRAIPEDDPTHRKPDIEMAKRILGWNPHIYLNDGLKRTIEYFRNKLSC